MTRAFGRKKHLMIGAALICASAAQAETLTCRSTEAWRLEESGLVAHPQDFYGIAWASDLRADPDVGTFSSGEEPIPDMELRSRPDPATGADLVFSSDDGQMLFRARYVFDDAIPFLLVDTYDIYVGTCER